MEYTRLGNTDIEMSKLCVDSPVVGGIDRNPEDGVILLDEKK